MSSIILYRLAILWATLFALGSLCTCLLASLQAVDWSTLSGQKKLMIVIAIVGNFVTVMMAFVSKEAKSIQQTGSVSFNGMAEDLTPTPQTQNQLPNNGQPK